MMNTSSSPQLPINEEANCTTISMYLSCNEESIMSSTAFKTLETTLEVSHLSTQSMEIDVDENRTLENSNGKPHLPMKIPKNVDFVQRNPLRPLAENLLSKNVWPDFNAAMSSTPSKEQLLKTVDVTRGSDVTRCLDFRFDFKEIENSLPSEDKENVFPDVDDGSSASSSVEIATTVIEGTSHQISEAEVEYLPDIKEQLQVTTDDGIEEQKALYADIIKSTDNSLSGAYKNVDKNIEMKSGSDVTRRMDLRLTFKEMDGNKPSNFDLNSLPSENKENVFPNIDEGSSVSSLVEIATTVIEGSSHEISAECLPDIKKQLQVTTYDGIEEKKALGADVTKTTDNSSSDIDKNIVENIEMKRDSNEMKTSTLTLHGGNLPSKKPSKILPPGQIHRQRLDINDKLDVTLDPEEDVCKLINKMLKISGKSDNKEEKKIRMEPHAVKQKISEKAHPMPMTVDREKKRTSFSHRMSIVVKTTLNSPARSMARKSILGSTMHQPRRSVIPTHTKGSKVNQVAKAADVGATRKSMLPKAANFIDKTRFPSQLKKLGKLESLTKNSCNGIKNQDPKSKAVLSSTSAKPEATFVCHVCKEKFTLKSLLDAHKRTHEEDINPVTCFKRLSTIPAKTAGSIFGSENQCKYCDKKFALLRALHIHLLQNCPKIPPGDKRKLQLTEMDHVQKAQLPNVFANKSSSTPSNSVTPRLSCNLNVAQRTFKSPLKPTLNYKNTNRKSVVAADEIRVPSYNSKLPKIKQKKHSGVYRTPTKLIPCHLCDMVFKNILDYTNHNVFAHGKKLLDKKTDALFKED
uniref:C2H2-type domain-containing protein n=1 Tax=Glossina brevipalpis TaxID=37001 RepID=A0A1A9WU81_9MUSC